MTRRGHRRARPPEMGEHGTCSTSMELRPVPTKPGGSTKARVLSPSAPRRTVCAMGSFEDPQIQAVPQPQAVCPRAHTRTHGPATVAVTHDTDRRAHPVPRSWLLHTTFQHAAQRSWRKPLRADGEAGVSRGLCARKQGRVGCAEGQGPPEAQAGKAGTAATDRHR